MGDPWRLPLCGRAAAIDQRRQTHEQTDRQTDSGTAALHWALWWRHKWSLHGMLQKHLQDCVNQCILISPTTVSKMQELIKASPISNQPCHTSQSMSAATSPRVCSSQPAQRGSVYSVLHRRPHPTHPWISVGKSCCAIGVHQIRIRPDIR